MAFTVAGVLFIIIFGVQLAYEEFFLSPDPEIEGHPVRFNNSEIIPVVMKNPHSIKLFSFIMQNF